MSENGKKFAAWIQVALPLVTMIFVAVLYVTRSEEIAGKLQNHGPRIVSLEQWRDLVDRSGTWSMQQHNTIDEARQVNTDKRLAAQDDILRQLTAGQARLEEKVDAIRQHLVDGRIRTGQSSTP